MNFGIISTVGAIIQFEIVIQFTAQTKAARNNFIRQLESSAGCSRYERQFHSQRYDLLKKLSFA